MAKKITRESASHVIDQDEIARCAYALWESEGRPEGRATQHWFEAESRLRSHTQQPTGETVRAARTPKAPAREPSPMAVGEFQTIK